MRLDELASDMLTRVQRERSGRAIRGLPRGLRLDLSLSYGRYTLTMSRPTVPPSAEELAICRAAFRVRDDASVTSDGNQVTVSWRNGK